MSLVIKNTLIILLSFTFIISVMKMLGDNLQKELLISTGKIWILIPGTIIHELSHLIICILFGLHLDDVSLFHYDKETGELGSVSYSYDPKSFKDRIGVSLTSVAPIFGISFAEYIIYGLFFRDHIKYLVQDVQNNQIFEFIKDFFINGSLLKTILFIAISMILLSGYSISAEDIHGILSGIVYLIILIFVICFLSFVFEPIKTTVMFGLKMLTFVSIPMVLLCVISSTILRFA